MRSLTGAVLTLALTVLASATFAQINAGQKRPESSLPFALTRVASFNLPFAFPPDERMLITEKPGATS